MIFHGYVKLPEGRSFHLIGLQVKSKASQLFSAVEQRFAEQLPNQLEEPAPRRTVKRCGAGGGLVKRKTWEKSWPIDTFLVGWTSIYQLFWGSLGTRVLTHPQIEKNRKARCQVPIFPRFWECSVSAISCLVQTSVVHHQSTVISTDKQLHWQLFFWWCQKGDLP